jgi:DNA ligase-1
MEFAAFADRAREIEAEAADLATVSLVSELFEEAGEDLPVVARFVQGRVFPAWASTRLDVGPSLCYEAVARAAGPNVSADDVEDRLADAGDVGSVAAAYDLGGQRGLAAFGESGGEDPLTVAEVHDRLRAVAAAEGEGSHDRKVETLFGLLTRASPEEARYLVRLVLAEMRIGVGEGTVRDAVAEAFAVPGEAVERALQVSNDYGRVARVARDDGATGLEAVTLTIGHPVQAMLAQAGTVDGALDDWEVAAVERKYDGARVQVHYDGEAASLFSRNMEDVTDALPEVVEFVADRVDVPAILDGEVVAVDDGGDPLPFQEVLRRFRRKHDVERAREAVSVRLHAFDCLHAGGADLLDAPLTERHGRLRSVLGADGDEGGVEGEVDGGEGSEDEVVSTLRLLDDADEVAAVEARSLAAGHEGIMLKNPDSTYTPGKRGTNWRKCKPDVETLDLVVTGAEWGEGRRAELFGTFECSVRVDEDRDTDADGDRSSVPDGYARVGNVATGFTDEDLAALTDLLEPDVLDRDGQSVDLRPAVVFEVGYEEIQRSPTYGAGYALRFPRFLGVREDLDPADADSLARVARLAGGAGGERATGGSEAGGAADADADAGDAVGTGAGDGGGTGD